jgi:hypothetical protein
MADKPLGLGGLGRLPDNPTNPPFFEGMPFFEGFRRMYRMQRETLAIALFVSNFPASRWDEQSNEVQQGFREEADEISEGTDGA